MPISRVVTVDIGDIAVGFHTTDAALVALMERRFHRFLKPSTEPAFDFDITVVPPGTIDGDDDLQVRAEHDRWVMRRGDFRAEWNVAERRGRICRR